MIEIEILPQDTSLRKSRRRYKSRKSLKNMANLIKNSIEESKNKTNDEQLEYFMERSTELFKSQGGYLSLVQYDESDIPIGLRCKSLLYNKNYGDPEDILIPTPPVDIYFPLQDGSLHSIALKLKKALICNDNMYLKDHQCPGVKIHNILYYPISWNKKIIAILCLINRQGGYTKELVHYSYEYMNYISNTIHGAVLLDRVTSEIKANLLDNLGTEKDFAYYILNNSKEIALAINEKYEILSISKEARSALKNLFNGDFELYSKITDEFIGNEEVCEKFIKRFELAFNGEISLLIKELPLKGSSNSKIYWDCFFSPIYNKSKITGVFMLAKNITEHILLQKELEKAKNEALIANKMKDEYMSRMSHELRTPLNSIIGFAQLIYNSGEELVDNVKHILNGGNHLLKLINEILDLSAIESGKFKLSIERIDLNLAISESINMMKSLSQKENIEIINDIDAIEKYYVNGDYHRIQQVLINIISNGIKYNKANGTVTLTLRKSKDNKYVILHIIDTGVGIDQKYMDQLYIPFNRLNIRGDVIQGTGLGLVLSKSLIEKMDGRIEVESELGIGTVVKLYFELSKDQGEIKIPQRINNYTIPSKSELIVEDTGKPLLPVILYIEDNPSNYKLMESIVKTYLGFKLISANMGTRGYELGTTNKPDLIILDLGLPDISGEELLVKFRKNPSTANVPIIVNSAYASTKVIERVLDLGANKYITKPFNISELIYEIRTILGIEKATN